MLIDPTGSLLVSNLGWVDRGALWVCDGVDRAPETVQVADSTYLKLSQPGEPTRLTIQHATEHGWRVSCRDWAVLSEPVCVVDVLGWSVSVDGDLAVFGPVPSLHVSYMGDKLTGWAGYYLLEIAAAECRVRRLDWFDDRFDWGYQSVLSALAIPSGEFVFGVQRCSDLFVCDPDDLSMARPLRLPGAIGNPIPFLRNHGAEMWAVDYDTVACLDTRDLAVKGTWPGQGPRDGFGLFLGEAWLSPDENRLLVARPGTGDVVDLDPESMSVRRTWRTGREPLRAAEANGRLVARDWKSGDLLGLV